MDTSRSPHALRPSGPVGPADAGVASAQQTSTAAGGARVVLDGRVTHAGPIPSPQSILPYRHALVVNEYEIVKVVEGQYAQQKIQVAQWAIRDGRVLADAKKSPGSVVKLTVERFDAHPELEGERLITDLAASNLPLYYEVKK
jgi:hypothetical protein